MVSLLAVLLLVAITLTSCIKPQAQATTSTLDKVVAANKLLVGFQIGRAHV